MGDGGDISRREASPRSWSFVFETTKAGLTENSLSDETGEDIDKGMAFEIIQAERSGNNLKFIVPLAGKVDDDAIAFELLIEGNRLKGHGHELRNGSKNLPVTFKKQN